MLTCSEQIKEALRSPITKIIPKVTIRDIDAVANGKIIGSSEYDSGAITGTTLINNAGILTLNADEWGEWISRAIDLGDESNNLGSGATVTITATLPGSSFIKVNLKESDSQINLASALWGGNDGANNWQEDGWYSDGQEVVLQTGMPYHRWLRIKITFERVYDSNLLTEASETIICEDGSYLVIMEGIPTLDYFSVNYTKGMGTTDAIDVSSDLCGSVDYAGDLRNFVCSQLSFYLNNTEKEYSFNAAKYPLIDKGNEVKFSVGIPIAGETYDLPLFSGVIEARPSEGVVMQINALDDNAKLTMLPTPTGIFGTVYAWRAIRDIYERLGFTNFDFDQSITTTLPAARYFQSETFADVAVQKLLEVICARLWITPTGAVKLEARNDSASSDYTIDDNQILWNGITLTPYENLISRLTVMNTDDSQTEQPETIIGTASGTLTSAQFSTTVTINFTTAPIIKIRWKNTGTCSITEQSRSCGYWGSNGNIQFVVTNPNYPSGSATYNLTAYGRIVQTTDSSLRFSEKIGQPLWEKQKGQDVSIMNRFLLGQTEVDYVIDTQMSDYGFDFNKIMAQTIFLPFLEFNDAINISSSLSNLSRIYYLMGIKHSGNLETGKWTSEIELMDKEVVESSILYDTTGINYDEGRTYDYYV